MLCCSLKKPVHKTVVRDWQCVIGTRKCVVSHVYFLVGMEGDHLQNVDKSSLKKCLISSRGSREQRGVAAVSLQELRSKGCVLLALDGTQEPITIVLTEDGTIVEDEEYFQCLPQNTKFMFLCKNETWASSTIGGCPAWLSRDSETEDEMDSGALPKWKCLARQLKQDLSSIILMSEEELQSLVDVPCQELAQELAENQLKVQSLQRSLQRVLDRREEERQSKQLLQLYLEALKTENTKLSRATESAIVGISNTDEVDMSASCSRPASRVQLSNKILHTIKEKEYPELSLSNQELEAVSSEDTEALALVVGWEQQKVQTVQQACQQQLSQRLQQVQSLRSLRSVSQRKGKLPLAQQLRSKRKK
ncbi:DNA fragmentation factor subunit alpha [Microcaecilia unicolor]|uniref:DNAation factor subunit alpha n=1 Tax=Microcaecilia unicolor TaxID=1415580 RepID=A0A6P7ZN10_9AMPH|nr:DNA fragmentation factor subunit alpha [Microcaecilia unicolor]